MTVIITTTPATASTDYSVTVTEAIAIVQRALMTTDYSSDRIKDAIEQAVNHALRETHCNMQVVTFSTVANTADYDVEDIDSSVRSPRILGVTQSSYILAPIDYATLLRKRQCGSGSGRPMYYSSQVPSAISIYPTPTSVYSLSVKFWAPCVDLSSGSTIINVPREFLIPILRHGAAALVTTNDPDTKKDTAWARFLRNDLSSIKRACYPTKAFIKQPVD